MQEEVRTWCDDCRKVLCLCPVCMHYKLQSGRNAPFKERIWCILVLQAGNPGIMVVKTVKHNSLLMKHLNVNVAWYLSNITLNPYHVPILPDDLAPVLTCPDVIQETAPGQATASNIMWPNVTVVDDYTSVSALTVSFILLLTLKTYQVWPCLASHGHDQAGRL